MKFPGLFRKMLLPPAVSLILLAPTHSAAPPEARPPIPDIETFMKIGSCGSPEICGTTGQIFFVSSMSGVPQLYRLTAEGWPYQLTIFDDGIDWYSLSPDGDQAIVGASSGGSEQSQLYLVYTSSGSTEALTHNPDVQYGSVIWRKDGGGFYFRSNLETRKDFRIYFHDLVTGDDKKIFNMSGTNFIADLSSDGKYLLVSHIFSNSNNDLYIVNIETGDSELLTPHKDEALFDSPSLTPDNMTVFLISNANPEGLMKLAKIQMASKKLEVLDLPEKWTVDELRFSDDRRYMAWLVNKEGYSEIGLKDMAENRTLPSPPLVGLVSNLAATDAGELVFAFTSPTSTQDIWLWDWRGPELIKKTNSIYAGIDPNIFLEPRLIKYKSFDGLEVPAFLYLPPGYDGKPIPFIIHIHGGPESQFRPYFQRSFQYLLLHGYGILAPNIRGSSGYGRKYQDLDNYKLRLNSIKDIKAGCDYLTENKFTARGMIGIKGGSYGGYAVLAAITEYPDLFSAAVDEVGIANFVTYLKNTSEYRRDLRAAEYGPLEDSVFLSTISPINKASLIKTPLLVIHGENDPRVPVDEARQIIRAISNRAGAVDSLIFPDEGHGVNKKSNNLKMWRKVVEFFDYHLKGIK